MMGSAVFEFKDRRLLPSPSQHPYFLLITPPPPPPPPPVVPSSQSSGFNLNSKVSPSILLIIIILAVIFFISGVLHLLVRFLLRHQSRDPDEMDTVTDLQGQLQQLFHLHDAGVDQSFIDTLPVFNYKAIIGVKDLFDCAVCLCEFDGEDKLRLLPKCSHAFHMVCIDTWLLSHSTCPLCRASLLSDFTPNTSCSPIVLVLESGSESSREMVADLGTPVGRVNSHLSDKSCEILDEEGGVVIPVKLGKFKNIDEGEAAAAAAAAGSSTTSNEDTNNAEARRCFSMGSFAYVMDETSSLQVPIKTPLKKPPTKKCSLPLKPGHRPAMSECGCDSKRQEFNGFEAFKILHSNEACNNTIDDHKSINHVPNKKESFSVSKIWLRSKPNCNATTMESSRRAFSFRFPVTGAIDIKANSENGEEVERCDSLDSQPNAPSFARRTLLWFMGKPNKVIHSSFSTNA